MDFIECCKTGDINSIKQMSLNTIKYNCDLDRGFRCACMYGHINIVRYLCELYKTGDYKKINIHTMDEYGFRWACYYGHINIVRYLCELYKTGDYDIINIHADNEDGFRLACWCGHYNIILYLTTLYKKHKYKPIHFYIEIFKKINKHML